MSATRPAATSRAACLKSRFSSLRVGRAQIRAGHFFVNSVKPKRNRPADIYPELLREAADFACDREVVLRREEQTEIRAAKHIEDRLWFRESGEIAEKVMPLHRPVCALQNEKDPDSKAGEPPRVFYFSVTPTSHVRWLARLTPRHQQQAAGGWTEEHGGSSTAPPLVDRKPPRSGRV